MVGSTLAASDLISVHLFGTLKVHGSSVARHAGSIRRGVRPHYPTNAPHRTANGGHPPDPDLVGLALRRFHSLIRNTAHSPPAEARPRGVASERLAHPRRPPDHGSRADRCPGGNHRGGPEQLHQRRPRRPRADHRRKRHRSPSGRAGVRASAEPAITTRRCNPALSPIRTERKYS
jgi:hypothetical protein